MTVYLTNLSAHGVVMIGKYFRGILFHHGFYEYKTL